jgi:hypothetical protein
MAPLPPSPDRLDRIRRYALTRAAELDAVDRVADVLRAELPDLSPELASLIAGHVVADMESRLARAVAAAFVRGTVS